MLAALALLLIALALVLYQDRDFWFPDAQDSMVASDQQPPAVKVIEQTPATVKSETPIRKKSRSSTSATSVPAHASSRISDVQPPDAGEAPVAAITQRTVLPPLEVEVVAGDAHRVVRPGSNSVHVELQSTSPPPAEPSLAAPDETAAAATHIAADRVEMSADASNVVARTVKPGYPLLARQMKVQGSVILQALIGKNGMIQNLQILSGPPILAKAAEEAVRQWHFRPHYEGADAVETRALITVNFTISTN